MKIQSIVFGVLGGLLVAILPASAQTLPTTGDPNTTVCLALANIMPCGTPTPVAKNTTTAAQPVSVSGIFGSIFGFGGGSSSSSTTAPRNLASNISQGFLGKTQKNLAVILVKAPNHSEVYRIIGGKKFLIPNDTVFDSYGYIRSDLKAMAWTKIQFYPRVKLIKLDGDGIYYLTEGGMTRIISSQTVFNSYADSDEDVVIVNKIEFSLYPQNKYIFNESTYTMGRRPNVYLIGSGTKKLIFPDQLARDGVTDNMIAPVNQTEFDYYSLQLANATPKQRSWYQWF